MSELADALGVEALQRPAWLIALLPLVAAAALAALRSRPAWIPWAAIPEARSGRARRFDALGALALGLRAVALVALAAVLAGPVGLHRAPPEPGSGLDLVLVVDASGSMRALDAEVDGEWRTRLHLAREVVARFAVQRAAEGDRVGLVVFGEAAFTQCPLTGDGALLGAALERVEAGVAGEATALGDALALAVKRALGGSPARGGSGPLAGRVVVLLTDGRTNAGALSLDAATALAAGEGIRVHTVAIGSAGEEVPMASGSGAAGRGLRFERHDVDTAALERVADATGGHFFQAWRSRDLHSVYREIDSLERIPRPLPARIRHSERPEPFLALAAGCLFVEIAAARVWRRRLP